MEAPALFVETLDSGLRLAWCALPWARSVDVDLSIAVGSRYEEESSNGLAHFLEHMLFKGTARRPNPLELSSLIECAGASMNAYTTAQQTSIALAGPAAGLELLLDVAFDLAAHARLEPEHMELERQVILEEIAAHDEDMQEVCGQLLAKALWQGHPLALPVAGTKTSVQALTAKALQSFYACHYRPENAILSVTGNFDIQVLRRLAERQSQLWCSQRSTLASAQAKCVTASAPLQLFEERSHLSQQYVALGWHGPSGKDRRRFVVNFALKALANTMSSRLFQLLREERGLVYDIDAEYYSFADTGSVELALNADSEKMPEAIAIIESELHELVNQGFRAEEMERTRSYILSKWELIYDHSSSLNEALALHAFYDQSDGQVDFEGYRRIYEQLDAASVQEEMARWLEGGTARACVGSQSCW